MVDAREGDIFVGNTIPEVRGLLKLNHPMKHGVVNNWKDMLTVWEHTYKELKVPPDQHPVLLTETPLNPSKNREHLVEVFFETLNVPACFIQLAPILSLYASGRTTGVVLSSGDGASTVVPVGFPLCMCVCVCVNYVKEIYLLCIGV